MNTTRVRVAIVAIALLVGLILGVALDRVYISYFSQRTAPSSARPDLIGQWVDQVNGQNLEFNPDGTFAHEIPTVDMRDGGKGWAAEPQKMLRQWRWLDDEWIEMNKFGGPERARVVRQGEVLKLLRADGDVREYRRK